MEKLLEETAAFLWGLPLILTIILIGLYFTEGYNNNGKFPGIDSGIQSG